MIIISSVVAAQFKVESAVPEGKNSAGIKHPRIGVDFVSKTEIYRIL